MNNNELGISFFRPLPSFSLRIRIIHFNRALLRLCTKLYLFFASFHGFDTMLCETDRNAVLS